MAELTAQLADTLVDRRLTYDPSHEATTAQLAPIPWPAGKAPKPLAITGPADAKLPKADVLIVTWTVAEAKALADVLTPGVPASRWAPYTENWATFEPHLTGRSPARSERCLAHVFPTEIDGRRVMCAKSELHLSTDDGTLPLRALWRQMLEEVQPQLVISTGTAGGIGADKQLGDVLVTDSAKFNCTKRFASEPFAQQRFEASKPSELTRLAAEEAKALMRVNAGQLQPIATRAPAIFANADVQTVDFFAFDDVEDSYGLRANDTDAGMVEMDDAVLALVCEQDLGGKQSWLLIRNASDPQVPKMATLAAEAKWAAGVYQSKGYWTSIGSAICDAAAVWSL